MTRRGKASASEGIRKMVREIVARFHPERVIVFGSHARGEATEDSDVDLMVVMDTEEEPIHAAARIAAAISHPFPLDIIVTRPSDFRASLARGGVFATEVAAQGIVLHEA